MPKAKSPRVSKALRHNPLSEDIVATGPLRNKDGKRRASKDGTHEESFVDSKSSKRILKIGQELADEERTESPLVIPKSAFDFESRFEDTPLEDAGAPDLEEDDEAWGDEEEEAIEEADTRPEDLELFNKFMPSSEGPPLWDQTPAENQDGQGTNLADLILEKIAAHEALESGERVIVGGGAPEDAVELPAKVVDVYSKIGLLLSRYKSGKLPKPFKVITTLPQWEDLLFITRPESWTPNACYEATKIFVSGKPVMTQIFLEAVILDRVRDDIRETKKLNVHLYKALRKALYKPAAFFKGFLFPLVESGTCTLREAHIVASVLTRVSIPVLHSAAALLRLCDIAAEQNSVSTEGGGATNIFIRALLEKKYALPYKVIDALVFHFLRFRGSNPGQVDDQTTDNAVLNIGRDVRLPVLWHQSLLAFAQRYRNEITEDQREALLDLLIVKGHAAIGPEVRRELLEGRGRGVPVLVEENDGGDDTMLIDSMVVS